MGPWKLRWIGAGIALVFAWMTGAEALVVHLVPRDTAAWMDRQVRATAAAQPTPEQKAAVRAEALRRLAVPGVVAVAVALVLAPVVLGAVWTARTGAVRNGAVAVGAGLLVTWINARAVTGVSLVACAVGSGLAAVGGWGIRAWMRRARKQ